MIRDLARLASYQFDLLVIGGGIYGLAVAYDAVQRGLAVALIDRGDFGGATSFNHQKTAHGGLRSLQTGDLARARESALERRTLACIAPHLVRPVAFLVPTYRSLTRGRGALGAGLAVDGLVARDRNKGVPADLHLPPGRLISSDECRRLFPGVREDGLTGGAIWHDYQMHQSERLNLAFAMSASERGATLANYVEARAPLRRGGRIAGVRARDVLTGDEFDVSARLTLNAAGAWAGAMMAAFGAPGPFQLLLLKAMNLVTTREMGPVALGAMSPEKRFLFQVPWRGHALIGTSHSAHLVEPHETEVTDEELSAFLEEINQAFPALRLARDEITLVHRGLVPAIVRRGRPVLRSEPEIVDHARDGLDGAMSVIGVKYTTARAVAERVVDLALAKLGYPRRPCHTATAALVGGDMPSFTDGVEEAIRSRGRQLGEEVVRHLVSLYGTLYLAPSRIAEKAEWRERVVASQPVIRAQIIYAVRKEMACTLLDVLARRTTLGSAGYPGDEAVGISAGLVQRELEWSDQRVEQEIEAVARFYSPVEVKPPYGIVKALNT